MRALDGDACMQSVMCMVAPHQSSQHLPAVTRSKRAKHLFEPIVRPGVSVQFPLLGGVAMETDQTTAASDMVE